MGRTGLVARGRGRFVECDMLPKNLTILQCPFEEI